MRNVKIISDIQLEVLYAISPHLYRAINIVTLFLVLNFNNSNKVTVNIGGINVSYYNHELNKNAYHLQNSHLSIQ